MSLYKIIKEAYVKANQQDFIRSVQQQNYRKWQQYWFQYWFLALVLNDALKENLALLRVQSPSLPKYLMPFKYEAQNWMDFSYTIKRNLQNTPNSENAVLSREVEMILTEFFSISGFSNFEVLCSENTYNYDVTIHAFDEFCLGRTSTPGVGEIFYDDKLYNRYTNTYGMYNIKFHNGGTCGGLYIGKQFYLYHDGVWSKTEVALNDEGFMILTHTKVYLDNYVGYIARI
jgi:hypothetical protein